MADAFKDRLDASRKILTERVGDKMKVTDETAFVGLDAYKKVLEADVNYVILATPPGFRPAHIKAAVAAGKHIFAEKPVAVDGAGVSSCLESLEEITKKGLGLVAGTLYRHHTGYLEVDQARARRPDRRDRQRLGLVQHDGTVEEGSRAGVERPRVPDAQLAVLHLAVRRPHRRAGRAQHRRAQLGHGREPGARRRHRRTSGADRAGVRPHLRPLRHRLRVPRTASTSR